MSWRLGDELEDAGDVFSAKEKPAGMCERGCMRVGEDVARDVEDEMAVSGQER